MLKNNQLSPTNAFHFIHIPLEYFPPDITIIHTHLPMI